MYKRTIGSDKINNNDLVYNVKLLILNWGYLHRFILELAVPIGDLSQADW